MTGESISASLATQILKRFETKQSDIESFIRALVEVESPSGDMNGSRAVVDLLANTAGSLACVDDVKRIDVPDFGQHLVVKAFQLRYVETNDPFVLYSVP